MKKVLIILNPQAGTRQANKHFADIIDIFCKADYEPVVLTTAGRGYATTITEEKAKDFDLVVCIGGDGTFNETIEGLINSGVDIPVGYIPAGSTNDFASSLRLPKNILESAENIVAGKPRSLDVGSFNGRYFSYVASFGAFTSASYTAPQTVKHALGHLAYVLEGIKDIPSIKSYQLRIKTAQGVYGGSYLFGAVSNSTSVGGILTLSDDLVDMNDGKFEVLLIKTPSNIIELNQILFHLTTQNYQSPMISLFSSEEVEVTADQEMPWTLDGEYQEGSENIVIKNVHNAIQLMTK
ncbi:diacylglycerol kinase (ATP) [Clostridiales Family XIII bacterium PM5-7]